MSDSIPYYFQHLHAASASDVGRKRKNNEDAHGEFPRFGVWCVADGMGGGDDGEVASAAVIKSLDSALSALPEPMNGAYSATDLSGEVVKAIESASAWIYVRTQRMSLKGCGSTFVGVLFDPTAPETALALHVGDSRLYRLRGRSLKQITKDHSVAEMMGSKDEKDLNPMFRGMILRAVGIEKSVEVDTTPFSVRAGDVVFACSDGLTRMVSDDAIANIIHESIGDPSAIVQRLIHAANAAGGIDNVTVSVIEIGDLPSPVASAKISLDGDSHSNVPRTASQTRTTRVTEDEVPSAHKASRSRIGMFVALGLGVVVVVLGLVGVFWGRKVVDRLKTGDDAVAAPSQLASTPTQEVQKVVAVPPQTSNVVAEAAQPEVNELRDLLAGSANSNRTSRQAASMEEVDRVDARLKVERERREREEQALAARDIARREVAEQLASLYTSDEFIDFVIFGNRILGQGAGDQVQKLARDLMQRRRDADLAEYAPRFMNEVIAFAKRIEDQLNARQDKSLRHTKLSAFCRACASADLSSPLAGKTVVALIREVNWRKDSIHGSK